MSWQSISANRVIETLDDSIDWRDRWIIVWALINYGHDAGDANEYQPGGAQDDKLNLIGGVDSGERKTAAALIAYTEVGTNLDVASPNPPYIRIWHDSTTDNGVIAASSSDGSLQLKIEGQYTHTTYNVVVMYSSDQGFI